MRIIRRISRAKWHFLYILFCILIFYFIGELIITKYYPIPYRVKISRRNKDLLTYGFIEEGGFTFKFPDRRNPNEKRILFLGDSFVDDHKTTFNNHFASYLYKKKHKYNYTVRSVATGGWGTDQEYIAFNHLALNYKPDIVILVFCLWNDIANNLSAFESGNLVKPYFILKDGELIFCNTDGSINQDLMRNKKNGIIKTFFDVHSILCQKSNFYFYLSKLFGFHYSPLISDKDRNIDGSECSFSEIMNYSQGDILSCTLTDRISHFLPMITKPKPAIVINGKKVYISDYGYELTNAILRKFDREIKAYGGVFYVLILPFANPFNWRSSDSVKTFTQEDGQQVTIDFTYQIRKLKKMCAEDDINIIDFTDAMENKFDDLSTLINSVDDVHYNYEGRVFVAEELYKYFLNHSEPIL